MSNSDSSDVFSSSSVKAILVGREIDIVERFIQDIKPNDIRYGMNLPSITNNIEMSLADNNTDISNIYSSISYIPSNKSSSITYTKIDGNTYGSIFTTSGTVFTAVKANIDCIEIPGYTLIFPNDGSIVSMKVKHSDSSEIIYTCKYYTFVNSVKIYILT